MTRTPSILNHIECKYRILIIRVLKKKQLRNYTRSHVLRKKNWKWMLEYGLQRAERKQLII